MSKAGNRERARELARQYNEKGQPMGWFEHLYVAANGDEKTISWADMEVNPNLQAWLDRKFNWGTGKKALVVGCGLGDDAEELSRQGFEVTAFDISPTAIEWCKQRFPNSKVNYLAADLLQLPQEWANAFDLVVEIYTIQVLDGELRQKAFEALPSLLAPGGTLLVICRGRAPEDDPGNLPWPLTKAELAAFTQSGLQEINFEDILDSVGDAPTRRFRVEYRK